MRSTASIASPNPRRLSNKHYQLWWYIVSRYHASIKMVQIDISAEAESLLVVLHEGIIYNQIWYSKLQKLTFAVAVATACKSNSSQIS